MSEITVQQVTNSITATTSSPGAGSLPSGGTSNQILVKTSGTDFASAFQAFDMALASAGTLAVARGGTGVTSIPMVGVISAADAGAARTVLGLGTAATAATGTGSTNVILGNDSRLSDARTPAAHTHADAYTGQIETAADKTYTIDPGAVSARTITGFYIKCGSGTVTATLKNGSDTVKAASVSTSSGDQTSLANTTVSANGVISIVLSSNSSATDVIFAVEYTA